MGCEYQYVFVGNSGHYDFLSHNAGQCVDPFFEKGIANCGRLRRQFKAQTFL